MDGHFEIKEPVEPIYTGAGKFKIKACNTQNGVLNSIAKQLISYNTDEHYITLKFDLNKNQVINLLQQCKDAKKLNIIYDSIEYRFDISYKNVVNINDNYTTNNSFMYLNVVFHIYALILIETGFGEIKLK